MTTLASDYSLIADDQPMPARDETWRLLRRTAEEIVAGFIAWRARRRDARAHRMLLAHDPAEIEFVPVRSNDPRGRLLVVIQTPASQHDNRS